jgi:hypothetical protein
MSAPAQTRRPTASQRCGLLHITGPLKESHRRTLVRRLLRTASTRAGRDLGKLAGYTADGDGLLVATSSDRLAMYLGLSLEQPRRRALFGLTPGASSTSD